MDHVKSHSLWLDKDLTSIHRDPQKEQKQTLEPIFYFSGLATGHNLARSRCARNAIDPRVAPAAVDRHINIVIPVTSA